MNKNEWSMYQLLMRWVREDISKAEETLRDLATLMERFKPEDSDDDELQ